MSQEAQVEWKRQIEKWKILQEKKTLFLSLARKNQDSSDFNEVQSADTAWIMIQSNQLQKTIYWIIGKI